MSDFILGLAAVIQKEINMLSTVAQNSANANTVGYKAVQEFSTLVGMENSKPGLMPLDNLQAEKSVRLSDGALRYSGRNTDLALSGDAWFVVDTPQGTRLTRDGRFHIDQNHVLVTANGWPVVGESGAIHLQGDSFSVGRDGRISQNGEEAGKLVLVASKGTFSVQPDTDGFYRATGPLSAATGHVVHQGALEQSNVTLSTDMVRLMEASRHIESVQRALSAYDNVLSTGISQIGKE